MSKATVARGIASFGCIGTALGGIAGSVHWLFVGTAAGAAEGALAGIVIGALNGGILGAIAARTTSKRAAQLGSGLLATVAELLAAEFYRGPIDVPVAIEVALVLVGIVAAVLVGPLVAFGAQALPANRLVQLRQTVSRPPRSVSDVLVAGLAVGAVLGAIAGFIVGVRTYLPTSPFAAVEGAIFGALIGLAAACITVGIAGLSRLRAHR